LYSPHSIIVSTVSKNDEGPTSPVPSLSSIEND
jgi:hypothetical protein